MPIRVLIADDHPLFRRGLAQTIREDPALDLVHEAGDGETALRLIAEALPDIAVLDIDMPRQTGLEVARAIRARKLPVEAIFITAHRDEDMLEEALSLGVKGYILKESAITDILGGIKAVAEGRHFISPDLSNYLLHRADRRQNLARQKPGLETLTPTEQRILKMIAWDRTSKEVAEELGISHRTVENHRANMAQKLGLHGSHSLLKFAYDNKARL